MVHSSCLSPRLGSLAISVPWLRGIVGVGSGVAGRREDSYAASPAAALYLLRLAHVPSAAARLGGRGIGMVLKAKTFVTRLVVRLQHCELASMLAAMAAWRRAPEAGCTKFVVLGTMHAWDDTTQKLRVLPTVPGARASTQRVSRTILVQKNMVHSAAARVHDSGGIDLYARAESFTVPPLDMPGKKAEHLRDVMLASAAWSGPIRIEDAQAMRGLAGQVDAAIITLWGDGASQNIRWLKHVAGVRARDAWGDNVLIDCQELCLLHQAHRIKVASLEAHSLVGMLYCMSKLARSGSLFDALVDNLGKFVDERLDRIVGGIPEPDESVSVRSVLAQLYDLDADHHRRGKDGGKRSKLWHDVDELLRLQLRFVGGRIVHVCAGPECCADLEASRDRVKACYFNLFVGHCWPEGTLSRWTHCRVLMCMVLSGYVCNDVLTTCLRSALEPTAGATDAEELSAACAGAGDSDMQIQHRARKAKVREFLSKPETPWQVAIVFLCTSVLDQVVYFLMTGGQGFQSKKPGTMPAAEMPITIPSLMSKVSEGRAALLDLLRSLDDPDSPCRQLFRAMGVGAGVLSTQQFLAFFRRMVLQMSAGLMRRFELRLGSQPYRLWVLCDDSIPEAEREAAMDEFLATPECCLGLLGQQLRRLFPTVEALRGPKCRLLLHVWMRTLIWSIYGCEKEHGSVRRLVGGSQSAGPGRNFSAVVRERVLETTRTQHIERVHYDPREGERLVDRPAGPAPAVAVDKGHPCYGEGFDVDWEASGASGSAASP